MGVKVCYVTHEPNLTGASQSLLDMLDGIASSDIEPVVLLRKRGPIEKELEKRGIPYKVIFYTHDMRARNPIKNALKRAINTFEVQRIKRFFEVEKVDLVHNNSFLSSIGMEAAYLLKIPYICHNREIIGVGLDVKLISPKRQQFLMEHAAVAIAISNAVYQHFFVRGSRARFFVLPDGIKTDRYFQERRAILEKPTVNILIAARIEPTKGQLFAVKAIEELCKMGHQNLSLTIAGNVGDPAYANSLKEYIQSHNLNYVSVLGFSDLRELRSICDIALVCSAAEGLGRVTIEGMLSGCLAVGAASGATVELIRNNQTGLLYEPENLVSLVSTLQYALENPAKMCTIARAGQTEAVEKYDLKRYCLRIREIYKEALGEIV